MENLRWTKQKLDSTYSQMKEEAALPKLSFVFIHTFCSLSVRHFYNFQRNVFAHSWAFLQLPRKTISKINLRFENKTRIQDDVNLFKPKSQNIPVFGKIITFSKLSTPFPTKNPLLPKGCRKAWQPVGRSAHCVRRTWRLTEVGTCRAEVTGATRFGVLESPRGAKFSLTQTKNWAKQAQKVAFSLINAKFCIY